LKAATTIGSSGLQEMETLKSRMCAPRSVSTAPAENGRDVERGSVIMTNKTQVVRLPKSVRFPEGVKSVDIQRRGRSLVVTPAGQSWAAWFDESVSLDFMEYREQPVGQKRAA